MLLFLKFTHKYEYSRNIQSKIQKQKALKTKEKTRNLEKLKET